MLRKAFISGIEGFIGRHFREQLQKDGWEVDGCDIKTGLDVRDWFRRDERCDLFIHCAAVIGGREKIEGSPIEVATNFGLDAEMYHWAVRNTIPKVVYFSSSAAYPVSYQLGNEQRFLRETDLSLGGVIMPDAIYGLAKVVGEILAEKVREHGVHVYVFRPFSGYGEDQDMTYPFPAFIQRIKERQDPFEIWGDGTQVRDWIHVDDIVHSVVRAIELDIQEPINIGNGCPLSLNELAETMFAVSGWHPKTIRHCLDKPSGVRFRCSNNEKLLSFYIPRVSLEEGIERALQH